MPWHSHLIWKTKPACIGCLNITNADIIWTRFLIQLIKKLKIFAVRLCCTTDTGTISYCRAVRYDDIYRMDEIKSISFHIMLCRLFRVVAKYIVYGNTFSSFGWLPSLHATTGREGETEPGEERPEQNEQLVPKRGTTSVAWTCIFKHCSFKTTDFKPLKQTTELCVRRLCFCVRGAHIFLPLYWLWTIT